MRLILAMSCALALTVGGLASATQCNIDLTNTGTATAFGVTITLPGIQTINPTTGIYSGGSGDDVFHNFTVTYVGGNTVITWTNPTTPYSPSSTIQGHVGFTPSSGNCDIVAFNFTSSSGSPLPGAGLPFVEVHWTGSNQLTLTNSLAFPVTVINPSGEVNSAIPLAGLNRFNSSLQSSLVQVGGADTISPGGFWNIHWPWPPPCPACFNFLKVQAQGPSFIGKTTLWIEAQ